MWQPLQCLVVWQMAIAGPNVTQLTDTVGQFLVSAEFPDFIAPGLVVPPLIPLRRMTLQRFMEVSSDTRFDLCERIHGLVAAIVAKATSLEGKCRGVNALGPLPIAANVRAHAALRCCRPW